MNNNLENSAKRFLNLASRLRRLGLAGFSPAAVQVSASQLALIEYAAANPGCGIQELAEALKLATPTVSISVRQLEKSELFSRQSHPEDGRAVQVFLTAKGKEIHQHSLRFHRQKFEQLLIGLTPAERETLLNLLERAIHAAEKNNQGDKS
ncbi:MAG: MarR family transcriptional regulator [Phycisphaerae bacterium]|nr:MarR family transcriptional regulator [Phycisphaerae bacterium]